MRRSAILIAFLGFATLLACARNEPADRPETPVNVLLITIDALRADSVSWNGSTFQTTPNLDGVAKDSVVFTQALTSFPGTTTYRRARSATSRIRRSTSEFESSTP